MLNEIFVDFFLIFIIFLMKSLCCFSNIIKLSGLEVSGKTRGGKKPFKAVAY